MRSKTVFPENGSRVAVSKPARSLWGFIVLVLLFAFPSLPLVHRYGGLVGVAGYIGFTALAWWLLLKLLPKAELWIRRYFRWLCGLLAAGLITAFCVGHPWENSRGPRNSSDRDDGLNLAVSRLVHGESPYYPPSDKAGPLSLLPGAIALGVPFALAGNSGYQNVFWVCMFVIVSARLLAGRACSFALTGAMLCFSTAVMYEFISGGDMLANGLYVPLAMLLNLEAMRKFGERPGVIAASAVFLGICLASRPNFALLLPLQAVALYRVGGFPRAAFSSVLSGLVSVGLCLAFYLPDPAGFTPLPTGNKLAMVDLSYPHASKILILITLLLALVAAGMLLRVPAEGIAFRVFRWSTAVTLFPMLAAVILFSCLKGGLDLNFIYDRYGLMYLPFALLGFGVPLLGSAPKVPPRSTEA